MSGYLPLRNLLAEERHEANTGTPIFQAHGQMDDVIQIQRAKESRDLLLAAGYQVDWHEYLMAHQVCKEELTDISQWLKKVLQGK